MNSQSNKQLKKIKQAMENVKPCNTNHNSWQDKARVRINKNIIRRKRVL